ncbi:MAG TPA: hypothetical protein VN903_29130, partial [Polyangia bacterium]|nr:hypothetical protein [Polyangia bacterium]
MRPLFCFRHLAPVAVVVATLVLGATRARADVAPEPSRDRPCTAPGQTCNRAGPEEDQPGTCVAATCTKQIPMPDGGTFSVKLDCFHCVARKVPSEPSSKSSGCTVAPERGHTGSLAVMGAMIGGLVVAVRRLRSPRTRL